jgi:microcystin-dependent protein
MTRQLLDDGFRHVRPPGVELGEVVWMGANVVMGPCFAKCEGGTLHRRLYRALSNKLAEDGYPWGDGDGTTTFTLPDLRERFVMGAGAGDGLTARALGDDVGEAGHVLTVVEMAEHEHRYSGNHVVGGIIQYSGDVIAFGGQTLTNTQATGDGDAHENRQPFVTLVPWVCVR